MDGLFGMLFPRKSKLYREFQEAMRKGEKEGKDFLDALSHDQVDKLAREAYDQVVDDIEQQSMAKKRKQLEDMLAINGFSDS